MIGAPLDHEDPPRDGIEPPSSGPSHTSFPVWFPRPGASGPSFASVTGFPLFAAVAEVGEFQTAPLEAGSGRAECRPISVAP
jgi:hypothetical protein